jgi:hypothetical protein
MSGRSNLIYKGGPETVTHETVHARFLELLNRDRDTGLSVPWKQALLEPANPLQLKNRPHPKLPVLLALCIAGTAIGTFVWFSFPH